MGYLKKHKVIFCLILFCVYLNGNTIYANATQDELNAEAEERKNEPVETNEIEGWPIGPCLGAEGIMLMDVDTGAVLYSKNADEQLFPASTTKIMTCLVAIENCSLDEVITVNQSAIDANSSDGSNMGLRAGEQLTLEELLYGILINSSNEACNAVAEHVAGSMDEFVVMMNEKAAQLGCTNTHFVSTNGLHNEEHYTCARDLALIARAFFSYDILCSMSSTNRYVIHETDTHLEHYLNSHNKLYEGQEYAYRYLVGSKTGFTNPARQTLVSCAEKDGMRLVCVVMKEESPNQFTDTVSLFEYGFNNFTYENVESFEKEYRLNVADFFSIANDNVRNTSPLIQISDTDYIVVPIGLNMDNLSSEISSIDNGDGFARIEYSLNNHYVGYATLAYNEDVLNTYDENNLAGAFKDNEEVIINIKTFLLHYLIVFIIVILVMSSSPVFKRISDHWFKVIEIKKRRGRTLKKRPINFNFNNRRTLTRQRPERKESQSNGFSKRRKNNLPPRQTTNRSSNRKMKDFNFDDFNL